MIPQLSSVYLSISLVLCGLSASAQDPAWHFESTAGKPSKLVWQTESGKSYDLWQATDLSDWQHVNGFPQVGTGAEMSFSFTAGNQGFFRFATEPSRDGFVLIPAGNLQMGDNAVGGNQEKPIHSVYVSAFYIGKYEVTKELWDEVRTWGLNNGYTDLPAGNGFHDSKGANHPVHSITWYQTLKWCNARSQKEGMTPCYTLSGATYKAGEPNIFVVCNWSANGYRLPTEAEWEKAARGGVSSKYFPWGDTIDHSQANYKCWLNYYSYDLNQTDGFHPTYEVGGYPYSSPVGSFAPNGYGIYDTAGNMYEYCWDYYLFGFYSVSSATDPRGPESGSAKVIRGGCWSENPFSCRSSFRTQRNADYATDIHGFRLARSLAP